MQHHEYDAQGHIPALDGLRGIAVALVITCHLHERMWRFLWGSVGVTIFFVLSGYLITRLALQEEVKTGRLHVLAFYIRRTFRIFPVYYAVLAIYAVLILGVHVWPAKIAPFRSALPYYLTYLQEIPYWTVALPSNQDRPFYQSWSLGIEEKFYLVWPLLMVAIARRNWRMRVAVVAVTAAGCVLQGIVTEGRPTYHLEHYGFILFGVCLALILSRPGYYSLFQRGSKAVVPLAVLLVLGTQFILMPYTRLHALTTIYALAMTVCLGAIVSYRGPVREALSVPWLVMIGKVSYAIYLIHILCIGVVERFAKPGHGVFVGVIAYVGTLALSTAIAYLSHRAFERPLIRLGRRLSQRFLRPAQEASV